MNAILAILAASFFGMSCLLAWSNSQLEKRCDALEDELYEVRMALRAAYRENEQQNKHGDNLQITRALINLAMSGVCPECGGLERVHTGTVGGYPYRSKPCKAEFHDHREALEAALAAPSDALLAERG